MLTRRSAHELVHWYLSCALPTSELSCRERLRAIWRFVAVEAEVVARDGPELELVLLLAQ
jgi:hypothetical protein